MFLRPTPSVFARVRHLSAATIGCALILAALGALAGCGVTSTTINPGGPRLGSATPTATSGGFKGTAVRPCPGPVGSVTDAGQPSLVITQSMTTATAHVGDLVQIQLPTTQHWTYQSDQSLLTLLQPAGVQDTQKNVCAWTFRAPSAGTTTLDFSGTAICDNLPCPQYVRVVDFTITVA